MERNVRYGKWKIHFYDDNPMFISDTHKLKKYTLSPHVISEHLFDNLYSNIKCGNFVLDICKDFIYVWVNNPQTVLFSYCMTETEMEDFEKISCVLDKKTKKIINQMNSQTRDETTNEIVTRMMTYQSIVIFIFTILIIFVH